MDNNVLIAKIEKLPEEKAKRVLQIAKAMIAALFIMTMLGTAIMAWFFFSSPNKAPYIAALVLLGVVSFCGGRMQRQVHEAQIFFLKKGSCAI